MNARDRLQATIDRLLRSLTDAERQGAAPPGFRFDGDGLEIDDGAYGDPDRSLRPDWLREQEHGWHSPIR